MASLSAKFFIFSLTLLLASSLIAECRRTSKQREFDYFVLALQWPGTICRGIRHCCSSNACCRGSGAPSEFTIHGLWTDYNDGTWPACCTNSRFDIKQVSNLVVALKKYWPSLSCGSPSSCGRHKGSFWAHESLSQTMFIFLWYVAEKHGTCSSPVIHDEYNYFLTTLNVYFKYNVTRVLNEAGYIPSNSEKYPLGGIISAVENAFHASPLIVCSKGAIEELRLCFYKDFKPRDCATPSLGQYKMVHNSKRSCPEYISLPVHTSLRLRNRKQFDIEVLSLSCESNGDVNDIPYPIQNSRTLDSHIPNSTTNYQSHKFATYESNFPIFQKGTASLIALPCTLSLTF
ncbi:hypothetical protein V2J09_013152 [Rumex salicifolius]